MSESSTLSDFDSTVEDRLKGIAFQFITLYERWSEDRQVVAQQGDKTAELIRLFTEQVKAFKSLESSVRGEISTSIGQASLKAVAAVKEQVRIEAHDAVYRAVGELSKTAQEARKTLKAYKTELWFSHLITAGACIITSVFTCLLLVWFLIPKPTLPLTDRQVQDLRGGEIMRLIWPKISKKEQQHWKELAEQAQSLP